MRWLFALYRDAFGGLPRLCWLLCTAAFLNRCGAMVVPFLGLYARREFGFGAEQAGLLLGLYGVGAIAGSWLGGFVTDRHGPVRAQIWSLLATGCWMLRMAALRDPSVLHADVLVLGLLNDAFRPGNISAVALSAPPELRRKALSLNRLSLNLGWAIGPTVGGFVAAVDFRWMFVANSATSLLAAAFLAVRLSHWQPTVPPRQPRSWQLPFRDRHFLWLMAANLLVLLAFMQYFTTGPRVFEDQGFGTVAIGGFLAVNPIVITLCEMPVVHALRARKALPLIALGSLIIGIGHLVLLLPAGAFPVVLAMAVVALGEVLQMPGLGAYVNDRAAAHARGAYNGAYSMCFCVALVLAPLLGGVVYERLAAPALWIACAGLGVLGALMFAVARPPHPPAP